MIETGLLNLKKKHCVKQIMVKPNLCLLAQSSGLVRVDKQRKVEKKTTLSDM